MLWWYDVYEILKHCFYSIYYVSICHFHDSGTTISFPSNFSLLFDLI